MALPREMELNPKAKGGVSPSWMETLTLEMEVLKMIGARIWGKVLHRNKTSLFDKEKIISYHGTDRQKAEWEVPCWLSRLRIQCCHCCGLGCRCGTGSIPGLRTFTCCGYSQKIKKKAGWDLLWLLGWDATRKKRLNSVIHSYSQWQSTETY